MKIATYAVRNYQFTLVLFIMAIALGVNTLLTMPRSEDPATNSPMFPVIVIYPGTSPSDMEELVVKPLEKKIYSLENIKRIKTQIKDGVAILTVEYKYESDVNEKFQELTREVNGMRSDLPAEILSIEVKKLVASDVNVIQTALISENASRKSLKRVAEDLQEQLEKLPELKNVKIHGLSNEQVRIDLRTDKLAQLHLPLNAVVGTLQSEIANIPGGSIDVGTKSLNVKTSGNYVSLDEIKNTIVYASEGKTIPLKDVADVYYDFSETKHITRLNGHRCVFVAAAQKEGFNISETQKKYQKVLDDFDQSIPSNVDMVTLFDQGDNVNARLGGLGIDFLIAILLVAITLLPLGGRASLVVMISIPLSLAIGLVLLNVMGFNINQLSIVGLVVALGLLVDDSIVVVENIERWLREGHSRMDATLMATKQIGLSVVGCTVTLIIAFLPLVFLPEVSGDFIRSLPMAVIASVLASMVVSLTIIPFLASRLLKQHDGKHDGNIFLRALQKAISGTYSVLLDKALKRPIITLTIAVAIFAGSLALFPVIGFSLFPASEKPQFMVNVAAPLQTNLNHTTKYVEKELGKIPEVEYYAGNVGKGNPTVYYNVVQENERSDFGQVFVQLEKHTSAAKKQEIEEHLRSIFNEYPGAKIEVKNFEQGPPIVAPVEIRLSGDNLDTLRKVSQEVENILKEIPGTMYVNNPVSNLKSDFKLVISKEKARALGINTVDIDRTVRLAIAGVDLGTFSDENNDEFSMLLTTHKGERATLDVFNQLYINNQQGQAVLLSQISHLELESSPLFINHYNKVRTVSVSAFAQKGVLADNLIQQVIEKMDEKKLPRGYSYVMGGEYESRKESFGGFNTIITITVFLFIAVLILLFKTFKSTLIVLSVIPLGIVGAVIALWMTGNSLSFVAVIGLIALAGIEVKNSILLVDFTNHLREEGRTLDEAIREAGEVRFLPIVLTSLTAIGGLIPIAISTNPLISPLAIVLIGGLISSTLLSRVVTPIVYRLIPPKVEMKVTEEI
jgi:multidrug efflux pump subunit AcrB